MGGCAGVGGVAPALSAACVFLPIERRAVLEYPGMNTIDRIKSAAEEARKRGEHPTRVFLTVDDGRKLQFELETENPRLGHRIVKEGIRKAVHKVVGLEVVWRSPEFKVS